MKTTCFNFAISNESIAKNLLSSASCFLVPHFFKTIFFLLASFCAFAQQENNTLIFSKPEVTIAGLDKIYIPNNNPTPNVLVSFDKTSLVAKPNIYVLPNTVLYTNDDLYATIVCLNPKQNSLSKSSYLAQTTSQTSSNLPIKLSTAQSPQEKLQNITVAAGVANPSSNTVSKKTATLLIATDNLQIKATRKQNFGYNADINNFLLEIQYRNRPPPAFMC